VTKLLDVIRSVLPNGTNPRSTGWDNVCRWPPDLFAVTASLAERSGLYSGHPFTAYWDANFLLTPEFVREVQMHGAKWAADGVPPAEVQKYWETLIVDFSDRPLDDSDSATSTWKFIVVKLLAICDEACAGAGFPPQLASPPTGGGALSTDTSKIPYLIYVEFKNLIEREELTKSGKTVPKALVPVLPFLPNSLCMMAPPSSCCVQPKTNTPTVGCTLRSLTHHLALLPSIGTVATHWVMSHDKHSNDERAPIELCNLLLVPFPYVLNGKCFGATAGDPFNGSRSFKLSPDWLDGVTVEDFAAFLVALTVQSNLEGATVHGIVFPETALTKSFANELAGLLAAQLPSLELLICGTVSVEDGECRNNAAMYRLAQGVAAQGVFQSKHHRWCLEADQIRRYNLGQVLDPRYRWWEEIEVSDRRCYVTLFREGATLSVLVCEDLARYDPVLPAMNAIGPNLVIALLMDGPQLLHRWPGRYATVLADDPGSSVLTLTSLGMVSRSAMPGEPTHREIALWKDPTGAAEAIKLPFGDHAVLLTLTSRAVEQFTSDGRGDEGNSIKFRLGAAKGVRHPAPVPPWLKV
jgi:hypothetical protein